MWELLSRLRRRLFPDPPVRFWRLRERIVHPKGRLERLLRPLYLHACRRLLDRCGAAVPCTEEVRPFTAPHGLSGIFISAGAEVGEGCVVFQQVTIGSNTLPDSRRMGAPAVGKNVYIGAGAKIIGAVTVGDNARIGANCVVTCDVPANATVVLPAPRIIPHSAPRDNTYRVWAEAAEILTERTV